MLAAAARTCASGGRGLHHGEQSLIEVAAGLDTARGIEAQLGTCLAQPGTVLRGREDGDVEDGTGLEQLLGGSDDFWEFVDGRAELFLQIADARRR